MSNVVTTNQLLFEPNKVVELPFRFLLNKQDVGKELEVTAVSLEMGDRDKRVLVLHWKGDCKNALTREKQTLMSFARLATGNDSIENNFEASGEPLDWNLINQRPNTM